MYDCTSSFEINSSIISPEVVEIRYTMIEYLASGLEGKVYKVLDNETNQALAMKIVRYQNNQESLDEVKYGCLLKQLSNITDSFIPVNNWVFVRKLPFGLPTVEKISGYTGPKDSYLLYTAPLILSNLNADLEEILTDREVVMMTFELIYASFAAFTQLGFIHRDIHTGNIGLTTTTTQTRIYVIDDTTYIIRSPYRFVFFDYGNSKLVDVNNLSEQDKLTFREDLGRLIEILSYYANFNIPGFSNFIQILRETPYQEWIELIAISPLFSFCEAKHQLLLVRILRSTNNFGNI